MTFQLPNDASKRSLTKTASKYAESVDLASTFLMGHGVSDVAAMDAGLGVVVDPVPGHEAFVGRLSIPYHTATGVVFMKFRCLKPHDCKDFNCVKYLTVEGSSTHIYNVSAILEAGDELAVCEGELDAVVASYQLGIPAVGIPGVANWRDWYWRLFDGYERVLVFGDGDEAGRDFAARVNDDVDSAIVVPVPTGHDLSSWYVEEGPEPILKIVEELR